MDEKKEIRKLKREVLQLKLLFATCLLIVSIATACWSKKYADIQEMCEQSIILQDDLTETLRQLFERRNE